MYDPSTLLPRAPEDEVSNTCLTAGRQRNQHSSSAAGLTLTTKHHQAFMIMRKQLLLLFCSALLLTFHARAQQASISGSIYDTINKQHLTNTTVLLMRQQDSILYKFTRSSAQGQFTFSKLKPACVSS